LLVHRCEREGDDWGIEDGVDVGDCVQDGNVEGPGGYEADCELSGDSLGDVTLWIGDFFGY
jgi:hypothetical protein